jgi:hypothetical protein
VQRRRQAEAVEQVRQLAVHLGDGLARDRQRRLRAVVALDPDRAVEEIELDREVPLARRQAAVIAPRGVIRSATCQPC